MTLFVGPVEVGPSPARAGWRRVAAPVRSDADGAEDLLWLDYAPETPTGTAATTGDALVRAGAGDAFLLWLAPLAAARHETLRLDVPVDGRLLEQVREVMRVWRAWYNDDRGDRLGYVDHIEAETRLTPLPAGQRVAATFTGGVDSFFTVLRHAAGDGGPRTEPVDDLLYVIGFDIPLANAAAAARVVDSLQAAASALGRRLVVVATNLRETALGDADWARRWHGAALAGVAHALGSAYHTLLIASSAGYRDLRPWGSHPLTDPMLSSSRLRIGHDGADCMRVEKTEYVVHSPIARRHLRVCWQSNTGMNCNACSTCYRTMLALEALDVLDACDTFDRESLSLDRAARIHCRHDFDVRQFGYVRDLAQRRGRSDIVRAVERALAGSRRLDRRLAFVHRFRDRPLVGRWAARWEARLRQPWIA